MTAEFDRYCPVCNGLEPFASPCPHCGHAMEDRGRLWDWIGPYSPYMPIAELAELYADADRFGAVACHHVATCPSCGTVQHVGIAELPFSALSGETAAPPAQPLARAEGSGALVHPAPPSGVPVTPQTTENPSEKQKELPLP